MADHSDVTQYLTNVLNYFAAIRQNYYREHAQLQELNEKFNKFWGVLAVVLNISDPSILQRGRKGDIAVEEFKKLLEAAREQYPTQNVNHDKILKKLNNLFTTIGAYGTSDAVTKELAEISRLHNDTLKKVSENTNKIDNAIAFNKIFSTIREPVVNHFTTI